MTYYGGQFDPVECWEDSQGWWYKVVDRDGNELVRSSESYQSESDAREAAKRLGPLADRIQFPREPYGVFPVGMTLDHNQFEMALEALSGLRLDQSDASAEYELAAAAFRVAKESGDPAARTQAKQAMSDARRKMRDSDYYGLTSAMRQHVWHCGEDPCWIRRERMKSGEDPFTSDE